MLVHLIDFIINPFLICQSSDRLYQIELSPKETANKTNGVRSELVGHATELADGVGHGTASFQPLSRYFRILPSFGFQLVVADP